MIQSTLEARDPVCGMAVEPSSAAARRTFEGRDIFFCAAGCAAAFDRDPKKYPGPDRPVVARRGVPLTLIFDRRETSPCSDEIVLPDLGIRRALPAHAKTRIEILPEHADEFPFSGGMNMLHGKIQVVE